MTGAGASSDIVSRHATRESQSPHAVNIACKARDISKAAENSAEASNEGNENAEEDKEKEAAATKIQAVFRGHHARKSLRVSETASKETKTDEEPSEPTQEQLQEEFRADDQELCDAAKKIQATFRGHMSRKEATTAAKSAMNMVESATAKIEEKVAVIDHFCTEVRERKLLLDPLTLR
ncbi:uncharacterized protein Igl isoform X2 [Temnothorax longispinosus]|uniref:uncharacterized protein Igl isoform X2 n=1 Tax=Temnothorax longispinosus TaxID=300112 RepID=UPI003A9A4E10